MGHTSRDDNRRRGGIGRGTRLRPGISVLLRDEHTVQVGLAQPLVLPNLTLPEREFLASLEDSTAPISAAMHRRFPHLVDALERHGALQQNCQPPGQSNRDAVGVPVAGPATKLRSAIVRIHGLGAMGASLAVSLARGGVGAVGLVDRAPAGLEEAGTFGLGAPLDTCAAATAWMLRERAPNVRLAAAFEVADVEVIIGHGAVPAHQAGMLVCQGVPHIPVVTDERGVTIGPAVLPGMTACVRCTEVARAVEDPAWPRLAMQCAGSRRPRLDPVASEVAAALIASDVVGVLRGKDVHGWRVDAGSGIPHRIRPVAPDPECGCGAAGPVGDEVAARRAAMHSL